MLQSSLTDRIHFLDDTTARRVLTTFARTQVPQAATELTAALVQALRDLAPEPATVPVSEGDKTLMSPQRPGGSGNCRQRSFN